MSMAIKGYLSNNQVIRTVRVAFLPFRKIWRKPGKYGQPLPARSGNERSQFTR